MKLKTRILGGVTVAGLISALSLTPAMAFTHHPGTPAEHQQTEDLNQQQLQQTQSTMPSTAMPPASMGASVDTGQTAQTMPNQTTPMADQTAQAMPNEGQGHANMASPMTASNDMMPLDSVSNSQQTLANASVETSSGQAVGAVQRVITDAAGKAKTVVVSLLGKASRMVAIAANQLTFDKSRNVVVAQMSAEQIDNMPMAPKS